MNAAVTAAKEAFEGLVADDGAGARSSFVQARRENSKEASLLAELESQNGGKPIVEAEFDIADVATCFEYYGGLATKITGLCESGSG